MKQLIVPIAIIVALIAFSVIADSSDPSRGDDAQTVLINLPVPHGEPPVSVLEMKSEAEMKAATDKASKAISGAEPKDAPVPAAVPVLTQEEAIKINDAALRLLSKKEDTIEETKEPQIITETINEDAPIPMAIPVLTPEEALKANKAAVRFHRNIAIARSFQAFLYKIGMNNNQLHFVLSLLPLLFIFDALFFWKKKKRSSKVLEYVSLPRRINILFSVSLLAFGILVFVPWSVYFGNSPQFPFIFQDFVNWNLRVLTLSILGASIILLLIPPFISDYIVAIIAGLGLCVYVQAMFMNQHLGTMDGAEPNWNEHCVFGTINMIIWILITVVPIVLKKMIPSFFSRIISTTTGIVLFLEILATSSMVVSAGSDAWVRKDSYYVDGSNQFQLSKEKNIVVIVMDALGSGFVKECFEIYPESKDIVKDFIWYADARSNYNKTFPALIHELTGTYIASANNFYDLFKDMWQSPSAVSFYQQIRDAGYDARFYIPPEKAIFGSEDYYHDYFSNIRSSDLEYIINYERIHFCLKQMSCFSATPFFIKKYFLYSFDFAADTVQKQDKALTSSDSRIFVSNSNYLRKLQSSGITTNAARPVLAFHYTIGAHPVWVEDEKCNKMEKPFDNPIPTTRACFHVLSELIRLLKEDDIYDNTAILVCSDHEGFGYDSIYTTPYDMTFMVKPFHENKSALTIDKSKVQSIDILPTLLDLSCDDRADYKDFDGYSSFKVPSDRSRKVFKLTSNKNFSSPDDSFFQRNYPGVSGIEEYSFVDVESFKTGTNSKSYVRFFPLIINSQEDK